jgi:NitT/TauT family transport system ATP-binding protein
LIETEAPEKEPQFLDGDGRRPLAGIALSRVHKAFPAKQAELIALADVSLECAPGEVLGVVGPSGCGKSTLLELMAGLQEPSEGAVTVEGRTAGSDRLARCALMPQRDLLLPWRSAIDNAALPLELHGSSRAEARRRVAPLFERFGLGSLDSITRGDMQEWLAGALASEPRTVVLVSHDVEEALFLCDRVLVLSRRPGHVLDEITVPSPRRGPRREAVTAGDFVALRERALEALA